MPCGKFLLAAALVSAAFSHPAHAGAFGGTWRALWCLRGQARDMCPVLEVMLIDKGSRVCGQFMARSPDDERVDGGPVKGISGKGRAVLYVTSQLRDRSVWMVRLTRGKRGMRWERMKMVKEPDARLPALDNGIPAEALLAPVEPETAHAPDCPDF